MAIQPIVTYARPRILDQRNALQRVPSLLSRSQCICRCHRSRFFSTSGRLHRKQADYKESFGTRLRKALGETKIKWYPIPVGVGIGFLGLGQLYRVNEREKARRRQEELSDDGSVRFSGSGRDEDGREPGGRPRRRERIKPTGPWFVSGLHTLYDC
jgi:phosphatidylserine decarboxylase